MVLTQRDTTAQTRREAVKTYKRGLIRDAAKRLFAERGLAGTSVRDIASGAGYTTGAIYFHYAGKEEIYADILGESLDRLRGEVEAAAAGARDAVRAVAAAFRAMAEFYDRHPHDLELGLYLFQGARPRGLTAELDRQLNGRLLAVLGVFREQMRLAGVRPADLAVEVAAVFDEMIGLLINRRTSRLKILGVSWEEMLEHHVAGIVARLPRPAAP